MGTLLLLNVLEQEFGGKHGQWQVLVALADGRQPNPRPLSGTLDCPLRISIKPSLRVQSSYDAPILA